jgi:hypothetical protein
VQRSITDGYGVVLLEGGLQKVAVNPAGPLCKVKTDRKCFDELVKIG